MNKDTLFEERSYEQIMENLGSPQSLSIMGRNSNLH